MTLRKLLQRLAPALLALAAAQPAPAQEFLAGRQYWERARVAADQNRYLIQNATTEAPNMEPRMVHPRQEEAAARKVADYVKRHGRRPNLLIFIVDDMGWGDFGPYGGGAAVGAPTPNVDLLARQGLLLTSTYAQPSCSPTRATLHTGQLPIQNGVLRPPMYGERGGITTASVTLPMLLKKQGYETRGVGKWHLGESTQNLPTLVGYDEYYGFLDVSDMYTEWRDHHYNPEVAWDEARLRYMQERPFNHYLIHSKAGGPPEEQCKSMAEITTPAELAASGPMRGPTRGAYEPCPKANQDKRVSIADLDRLWADYSVDFIKSRKDGDKPWFLYHATRGCHFDNYPQPGTERASYARTSYSACTVEMDEILGRLMLALRESGQDEDTLVFFTSDNGPEGEIEFHAHTPFRGGKGSTWEGGVRVPGIARWPGMIEAGRVSDGLFDLADLYPTFLALAGFDYARAADLADRYCYGVDQSSFLVDDQGASNRRSVLYWMMRDFTAVRMDEFKAHRAVTLSTGLHGGNLGGFSGSTNKMSYLWMFNLMDDPQEQRNILIRHLWAQGLFDDEFQRFFKVLLKYPAKGIPGDSTLNLLGAEPAQQGR